MAISFTVNGEAREVDVAEDTPLLWVLRDELRLTGTKFGCGVAQCGACTVHVNGQPRRSCVTPVGTLEGQEVTTVEGVSGNVADAVQRAWAKYDAPQCGYCQSGQVMTAVALLERNPSPTKEDVDNAFTGNICRCATYVRIRNAVVAASEDIGG